MKMLAPAGPETRIALVGASNDPAKYGNIILHDLVRKGFTVLPVNPSRSRVAGLEAYASVRDAPGPIHIVNFVVPPEITLEVVRSIDPERCRVVWFQPGSFDDRVIAHARRSFEHVIAGDCIMVVT